jgi:large subunit ribosomal protein L25
MASRPTLTAASRTLLGRKVKLLRREGYIPGHVFGKKADSLNIQVKAADFGPLYAKVGETSLIDLKIDALKTALPVLVVSVQRNPLSNLPVHIDFHQVSLTEKVTANIPVEIVGSAPAVTDLGGVMLNALSEIEIEALPTDLPENIQVDVSQLLNFGDSIQIKDLIIDTAKITVLSGADETVVTIQEPAKEEEPEAESMPAEAETTEQGKAEASETEESGKKSE